MPNLSFITKPKSNALPYSYAFPEQRIFVYKEKIVIQSSLAGKL